MMNGARDPRQGPARMQARSRVSVEQLARETACSERSVRRAIRALQALGVLSRLSVDEFVIDVTVLDGMPMIGKAGTDE